VDRDKHAEARDENSTNKDNRLKALKIKCFAHQVNSTDKERKRYYETKDVHTAILLTLSTALDDARNANLLVQSKNRVPQYGGYPFSRTDPPRLDHTSHPYPPPRQDTVDSPQALTRQLNFPPLVGAPTSLAATGFAQQQSTLSRFIAS